MKKEHHELVKSYKDAYWQYMLEHSDVTEGGSFFVKFHTSDRKTFEKHIVARLKGYQRFDDRTQETPQEKENRAKEMQAKRLSDKIKKKDRWLTDRAERKRLMEQVALENTINNAPWWKRWYLRIKHK